MTHHVVLKGSVDQLPAPNSKPQFFFLGVIMKTPTTIARKAIVVALMTALASTAFATTTNITADIEKDYQGTADDILHVQLPNQIDSITNACKIEGFGQLTINAWDKLVNESQGVIDVGHYGISGEGSSYASVLENKGTIYVNDDQFDLSLINSGSVVVKGDTLKLYNRYLVMQEGGSITQADSSILKRIEVDYQGNAIANSEVKEGALLQAEEIYIDTGKVGLILDGDIKGSDITIKGSYTNVHATGSIVGDTVKIYSTINQSDGTNGGGGKFIANKEISFIKGGSVSLKDAVVQSPVVNILSNSFNLYGSSQINGVQKLTINTTFSIWDQAGIENDFVDEVILDGSGTTAPRIQLIGDRSLTIDNLTVQKFESSSDSAKLVDKMTVTDSGRSSFTVNNVTVLEGAKLDIYADDKKDGAASTDVKIGTMNLAKDAQVKFGYRLGTYSAFSSKSIDTLILDTGSKLDGGSSDKSKYASIKNIEFKGDNASVTSTLVGDSTNVSVDAGVTGASLGAIETGTANIYLENVDSETAVLKIQSKAADTQMTVTSSAANNTGDSTKDLAKAAQSVSIADGDKTFTVYQEENEIFDGSSATYDGTKLGATKTHANKTVYGSSSMAVLGLHIWRNEINDMNKRLGELRDSSSQSNGVWARVYNGRAKVGSLGVTNKYSALQMGYDRQVDTGVWLGGAVSYTAGDNDFRSGSGDSALLAFTGYGSWLFDNGMFLDVTGKIGRMKNTFDIGSTSGMSSGSYHTNAVSVSAEAGWRFDLTDMIFVEPQVELMWGHVRGADYTTSLGVDVNQDSTESFIGRAGFAFGVKCPNNRGNAYVRASVLHDWQGDTSFTFSQHNVGSRVVSQDLGGTWYEFGIGANFNVTDQTHLYADVEASNGGEVDTDYRVNFGVRYSF